MMRQARFETEAVAQAEKDDYEVSNREKVFHDRSTVSFQVTIKILMPTSVCHLQTRQKILREQEDTRTAKRKQKREKKRV